MLYYSKETYQRSISNYPDRLSARYTYFKSGLIGATNSESSRSFFNEYKNRVKTLGLTNWGSDQQALVEIVESKKNVRIGYFENKYLDWHFNQSSLIWMGKGVRKDRDKIYLNEYQKYRKKWKGRLK